MKETKETYRLIGLFLALAAIAGTIYWLESQRAAQSGLSLSEAADIVTGQVADKEKRYDKAKELVDTQEFLNSQPFRLQDHVGEKVILIDFWTYSCINCQRTFPYLNAWWDKYKDKGLLIVGVHTPEFEFEKDVENLKMAIDKYDIEYPVVQDNNYATWQAYNNRYWPRKYLIDIDGYVIYDHIGEGAYAETEKVVQRLLKERMEKLAEEPDDQTIASETVQPTGTEAASLGSSRTPEIYFGSARNELLDNGQRYTAGRQALTVPEETDRDHFYLGGKWQLDSEYAENLESGAQILLHYNGQKVFMVAEADSPVRLRLKQDGQALGAAAGSSVSPDGTVTVQAADLYRLVENAEPGEHRLEIEVLSPGLKAFTFTFG